MNLNELALIAIDAAKRAGKVIEQAAQQDIIVDHKAGGANLASQVVTEIDRQCDALIREVLRPISDKHDIAMLTEEIADDGSRFIQDFFWCVDPLDGTLAFISKESGYAVSIALVSKEGEPVIGVVYNPSLDVVFHAIIGKGVFRNGEPWKMPSFSKDTLTYVFDNSPPKGLKSETIQALLKNKMEALNLTHCKDIYGGGAVWNAIRVLEHAPACYIKQPKQEKGGGSLWDFAATACIFHELGCRATDFNGAPLEFTKKEDTFMNHKGIYYSSC